MSRPPGFSNKRAQELLNQLIENDHRHPIVGQCWYCEKPMRKGDTITVGGVTKRLGDVKVHFNCVEGLSRYAALVAFKRTLLGLFGLRKR